MNYLCSKCGRDESYFIDLNQWRIIEGSETMEPKKQWVQHISGQGEKWELSGKLYNQEDNKDWQVIAKNDPSPFNYHYLPKSEYRLCDPPEVWRDVTAECEVDEPNNLCHGYRLRKVPCMGDLKMGWAFIVEQKVTQ